jgi:hypothetical protein
MRFLALYIWVLSAISFSQSREAVGICRFAAITALLEFLPAISM